MDAARHAEEVMCLSADNNWVLSRQTAAGPWSEATGKACIWLQPTASTGGKRESGREKRKTLDILRAAIFAATVTVRLDAPGQIRLTGFRLCMAGLILRVIEHHSCLPSES